MVAFTGANTHVLSLPFNIETVLQVGDNQWAITASDKRKYLVRINPDNEFTFNPVEERDVNLNLIASAPLPLTDGSHSSCSRDRDVS
jgi:hypothetical protein